MKDEDDNVKAPFVYHYFSPEYKDLDDHAVVPTIDIGDDFDISYEILKNNSIHFQIDMSKTTNHKVTIGKVKISLEDEMGGKSKDYEFEVSTRGLVLIMPMIPIADLG